MGKTKVVRGQQDQHKIWRYQRQTMTFHGLNCRSAGGLSHRKLRSGDPSGDMFLGIPSSKITKYSTMLMALLMLL